VLTGKQDKTAVTFMCAPSVGDYHNHVVYSGALTKDTWSRTTHVSGPTGHCTILAVLALAIPFVKQVTDAESQQDREQGAEQMLMHILTLATTVSRPGPDGQMGLTHDEITLFANALGINAMRKTEFLELTRSNIPIEQQQDGPYRALPALITGEGHTILVQGQLPGHKNDREVFSY